MSSTPPPHSEIPTPSQAWLSELDSRCLALLENSHEGIALMDADGRTVFMSPNGARIFGDDAADWLGRSPFDRLHPADHEMAAAMFSQLLQMPGHTVSATVRVRHSAGHLIWLEATGTNLLADPTLGGVVINFRDVTERRQAESALRTSEARHRLLAEHAGDIISRLAIDGTHLYVSPACLPILGYHPRDLVGTSCWELIHPDDLAGLRAASPDGPRVQERADITLRHRRRDGRYVSLSSSVRPVRDDITGEITEYVSVSRDVSERVRLEQELGFLAYHDSLTGLPNRKRFLDRLRRRLSDTDQDPERVAVMMLDLDRMKVINDGMGHVAGDHVLREVAARLTRGIRPGDLLARFGGDEFTVFLDGVRSPEEAGLIAGRLCSMVSLPIDLRGQEAFVGVSVGIALGRAGVSADEMLRNADMALYRAKDAGRGRWVMFDAEMRRQAEARLQMESELHRALDREEFCVHYLPEVELRSGRIVGVEALVRWRHPARGLLLPAEFLPLAEETGLAIPLGQWVRERAIRQVDEWNRRRTAAHPGVPPLELGLNLSRREFQVADWDDPLRALLEQLELPLQNVRLELPERALIDDLGESISRLNQVRKWGLRVVIDDFGSGLSSLGSLRQLPADYLKIDRAVVAELAHDPRSHGLLRALGEMARALDLEILAEGIETEEQRESVMRIGCTRGHGYLFSRPLTALEMELRLETPLPPTLSFPR